MNQPPYQVEFEIKGLPALPNQIMYRHWAVKRKLAKDWKQLVYFHTMVAGRPKEPLSTARVTMTRFSAREPHWDNLAASFKHVLDGLIEARVIRDDSRKTIGQPLFDWQKTSQKAGFIRVRVEEIPCGTSQ